MTIKSISDAFSDILLKAWLSRNVSELPSNYYVGLTLAVPTDQNGSGILEPPNEEYSRLRVPAQSSSWESLGPGSRLMTLRLDLVYPQAFTDWGEILGYTLHDALTGGNFLGYGVTNPVTITSGMRAHLPPGSLVVAEGAVNGRGGAPFWFDLSNDAPFPPEALPGDYGFDPTTGNVWRNA